MSDKMGRPTQDHKTKRITVRVNEETYEKLIERENVSEEARKMIVRGLESEDMLSESWDLLAQELCLTQLELYEAVNNAVEKKVLYNKNGHLFFTRGTGISPDYISLDNAIDNVEMTDKERRRIKERILMNIKGMLRQDDLGNGAGV